MVKIDEKLRLLESVHKDRAGGDFGLHKTVLAKFVKGGANAQEDCRPPSCWCSKLNICSVGHGSGEAFVRCKCLFSYGFHRSSEIRGVSHSQ